MTKGNKQSTRWQINSRIRVIFQYCVRIFFSSSRNTIVPRSFSQILLLDILKYKGVFLQTDLNKCLYGNLEIGLAKARLGSSRLRLLRWSLSSSKSYPQIQSMPDCIRLYSKDHLLKQLKKSKFSPNLFPPQFKVFKVSNKF